MFNIPTSLHWNESRQSLFIGGDGLKVNGSYTTGNGVIEYKLENTNYIPLEYTPGTLSNKVISGDIGERPSQYSSHYIAPFMSLQPDRIQFYDKGTKLFLTNENFVEAHYYNLADSYDITSAVLDSSMSLKNSTEATNAFTVNGINHSSRRTASDLMFNDSGTEVTVHQAVSSNPSYVRWTTFYLDSAFDLHSINNTTPVYTEVSTHSNGGLQQWLQNTHNTYIGQFTKHSRFADNGNKLIWYDPGYTDNMLIYNLPEPYNVHSIENWYGESADLFSMRKWDSGSWRDYSLNTINAGATAFFDFDFNDSGTRMWATDYGTGNYSQLMWQFDLNTAWDLQTVDSASWELIAFPDSGDGRLSTTNMSGIATTPNGMMYVGAQTKVDSSGNTIMGNHIQGWDLTKDSNNRPYIFPADSDNSYFRSSATHLISTVETGLLYSNDPRTASTGNVFALAINEGILADSSDSSYTTDSAYTVTIAQDDLYGGGYGNAFQLAVKYSTPFYGNRGVHWTGRPDYSPFRSDTIDYIDISTPGNAIDFGNYSSGEARHMSGGASNGTRGVFHGGALGSNQSNELHYITFATPGNSTDFGDLTHVSDNTAGSSDATRGLFWHGRNNVNGIDYITISTIGNATDFGNATYTDDETGAASGPLRNFGFGGALTADVRNIEYVTVQTLASATNFGQTSVDLHEADGAGDDTRVIIALGTTYNSTGNSLTYIDNLEYITQDTPGNSLDFGDLTVNRGASMCNSNGSRMTIAGGCSPVTNTIDYVTIQTPGNAIDFGDLTLARFYGGAASGAAA